MHQSTAQYLELAGQVASTRHPAVRLAAREFLREITELAADAGRQRSTLFASECDEDCPIVKACHYEASDRLRTIERLAGEVREAVTLIVGVLDAHEQVTARIRSAPERRARAAAPDDPQSLSVEQIAARVGLSAADLRAKVEAASPPDAVPATLIPPAAP